MSYYRVCPRCGAHLDHGELCDCRQDRPREVRPGGQKSAVPDGANIKDGK